MNSYVQDLVSFLNTENAVYETTEYMYVYVHVRVCACMCTVQRINMNTVPDSRR